MRARTARGGRRIRGRLHARARAMSESERAKWDDLHRGKPVGIAEPFLVEMISRIPRSGIALDVAAGRGRNSLAMARAGIRVVAVDFSETAMHALVDAARAEHL